jgi:hypothetical protein
MVNEQMIIGVLREALIRASKKTSTDLKVLRIKIHLTDDLQSAKCKVLRLTDDLGEIQWNSLLGLKVISFKRTIVDSISDKLHGLANNHGIEKNDVSFRLYAIDNNATPNIYLYNGGKAFRTVEINELV